LVILQKKVTDLTEAALERFVLRARRAAGLEGDVHVLVTSNAKIRSLNQHFRRKDQATDVLSFPSVAASFNSDNTDLAGDIAISADIAADNAARFGHTVSEEVKVLVLHGILHLAGFDHERDNGVMARKEAQLRQVLKLPSTLIERAHSGESLPQKKRRKRHRAGVAKV
jgi:probable rRNA maturation factor